MKRLLVCLLLVGVVGCGKSEQDAAPSNTQNTVNLTTCPDCGKEASRRAPACPQCGAPLTDQVNASHQAGKSEQSGEAENPVQADPNRKANALFVEAVQLIESAEAKSLGNAIKDYEQALMNIQTIIDDYSESDLAVKVISGEASFAGRTLADISLRLTELRNPAAALEKLLAVDRGLRRWQKDEEGYIVEVSFMRIAITDTDLVLLEGLPKLNVVRDVRGISDARLAHLKGLINLKELQLVETKITDAGLVHLKGLTNLQWLTLSGSEITDAGLEHLKGLTNLAGLSLLRSEITDAGLVHLKGLTNLQTLILSDTQITDAGLVHLKGLADLTRLSFYDTQITDVGVAELQKVLPDCSITH